MNDWHQPFKKIVRGILTEDLVIYGAGFVCSLLADVIYNAFFIIGLVQGAHDLNLGMGQIITCLLCGGLLVRKIAQKWTG